MAFCFLAWQHYLEGYPSGVTVIIDHQTLTRIVEQQVLTDAQMDGFGWVYFSPSDQLSKYQPGKANIVADALIRSQRGISYAGAKDHGFQQNTREDEDAMFMFMGIMITMQPRELKECK